MIWVLELYRMGERQVRNLEVRGSIPLGSTILSDQKRCRELYPAENRRILVFYRENCGFCGKKVRTFQIAFLPQIRPQKKMNSQIFVT